MVLTTEARGPLSVHRCDALDPLGVDAFVTDRFGGVSSGPYDSLNLADHVGDDPACVRENRRRVARAVGVDPRDLVMVTQVHGTAVADADSATGNETADALVLRGTHRAAAILVADCVPIVMVAPRLHELAVIHAGWRGLTHGVIAAARSRLGDDDVVVAVGPSISGAGYQVGPEVAAPFSHLAGVATPDGGDRVRLDLREIARRQLLDAGVAPAHIHLSDEVTDGGEMFFSDRAQRPCGRIGLVARWSS